MKHFRIHAREQLTFLHHVTFLHQHCFDPALLLRGHVHFSRFDPTIAESNATRNCGRLLLLPHVPADTGGGYQHGDHEKFC